MSSTTLVDEIQDMNLAYLLLARRLLADDRATALLRLKITEEQADMLLSLNSRQLTRVSRTNQLLCHLSLGSVKQLRQIVDNPREQGLSHLHSSLLMAGTQLQAELGD
ncbi:flagellar transcriptional regulator FlhD [Halomonas huangheensis]|uniref:Flagellar transcriptional regulator FlhD n=1 Tax=Halomonas huangheensis TaxID=1178482 RepID=W1N6R1_9GAMM|nr:flagellar transcriptional regulator FlhD [Halomonas huangheensis]ALM54275.1 transcriptional regulator [Halomonas huangheensis]ERL50826.1 hypothetical protein BJB45_19715 [Halomonas huangheensis]